MNLLDQHYTEFPHEGKITRARWLSAQVGYTIGKIESVNSHEKNGVANCLPKAKYKRTK